MSLLPFHLSLSLSLLVQLPPLSVTLPSYIPTRIYAMNVTRKRSARERTRESSFTRADSRDAELSLWFRSHINITSPLSPFFTDSLAYSAHINDDVINLTQGEGEQSSGVASASALLCLSTLPTALIYLPICTSTALFPTCAEPVSPYVPPTHILPFGLPLPLPSSPFLPLHPTYPHLSRRDEADRHDTFCHTFTPPCRPSSHHGAVLLVRRHGGHRH